MKMSIDNPSYFYNVEDGLKQITETSASTANDRKSFSFFRKRSTSKNNKLPLSPKTKLQKSIFRSNTLDSNSRSLGAEYPQSSQDDNNTSAKYRGRLGSYNESISYRENINNNNNDDVFYRNKYPFNIYSQNSNCSSTTTNSSSFCGGSGGTRRHSIGTFMAKTKLRSGSFSDEVPKMIAPKAPTSPPSRKFGENMDDILIVTTKLSENGYLWVNYLKTCFNNITKQRGRQSFNFLHVKIDEGPISTELSERSKQTKFQIVIICPILLSLPSTYLRSQLSEIIKPNITLGLLLDISEDKLMEMHKSAFPSFYKWKRLNIKNNDQSCLSELVGIAISILGRALREQPLSNDTISSPTPKSNQETFTVLPKKVKVGQNKIVALLTEPLLKDDWYKVKIEKMGEIIEVTNVKKRNPYTLQITIPDVCLEVSMMIGIRIEKNGFDIGFRPVKCESRLRELEHILKSQDAPMDFMCQSLGITANADRDKLDVFLVQSFKKNVPSNFDLLASLQEKQNFFSVKDTRPEEYPTLLHFAARYGLERLCLQLLEYPGGAIAIDVRNTSGNTPIEISENFGHPKIAASLRNFSQMHEFTTMYHYFKGISDTNSASNSSKTININMNTDINQPKMTEIQLDHQKNYTKDRKLKSWSESDADCSLSKKLSEGEEYMQMTGSGSDITDGATNAVTNLNYINVETYNKEETSDGSNGMNNLKLSDENEVLTNELKITEPSYHESKEANVKNDQFSQECLNLLENINPYLQSDYMIQPTNIPIYKKPEFIMDNNFGDYLTHPSNIPIQKPNIDEYLIQPSNKKVYVPPDIEQSHLKMNFKKKGSSLKRQGSDTSKTSADDELLEIINDFKNNVFTIQEVEQLVASWKTRNDVQQSFKDKQEQLQHMREEYERIQAQMKDKLKRPTPFERMKKIFTRNKSIDNRGHRNISSEYKELLDESKISSNPNQRPMSSLSLHSVSSSSSSGRMSTGSVCSGTSHGDSGTHSDHEDRRHIFSSTCRVGLPGSLMDNYMIPPTPRPVITPATTPIPCDEKDRLFPSRTGTPINSEHYIMFPSNLPVLSNDLNQNGQHDYMNFPGLNTIVETKETTKIENVTCVHPIKIQTNEIVYSANNSPQTNMCTSFKLNKPIITIKNSNNTCSNVTKDLKDCDKDNNSNCNLLNKQEV